jgi:hypothetical protein
MGALTAPTSVALTCRWRSRPQHQLRTHAAQQNLLILSGTETQVIGSNKVAEFEMLKTFQRQLHIT